MHIESIIVFNKRLKVSEKYKHKNISTDSNCDTILKLDPNFKYLNRTSLSLSIFIINGFWNILQPINKLTISTN